MSDRADPAAVPGRAIHRVRGKLHRHGDGDPSAPSRVNFRGLCVSSSLARRAAWQHTGTLEARSARPRPASLGQHGRGPAYRGIGLKVLIGACGCNNEFWPTLRSLACWSGPRPGPARQLSCCFLLVMAWPPFRRGTRSRSPRQPCWSTNCWKHVTNGARSSCSAICRR